MNENNTQAWLARANPKNKSYGEIFLNENFYAIGWGEVGDITHVDYEEIRTLIEHKCDYLESLGQLRIPLPALYHFRESMQLADFILMPDADASMIHVGQIIGGYYYNKIDLLIAHRRKVNWSSALIPRVTLSEELRGSLRNQRTIAKLSKYYQEIADLFEDAEPESYWIV